jgi:hypothetical protein
MNYFKHYYDLCTDLEELRTRVRYLNDALDTTIKFVPHQDIPRLYWLLENLELDHHYVKSIYND